MNTSSTPSTACHSGKRVAPRYQQRGAIGLMGVLTLTMALLFAVLAIDSGRLWMERRNLQKTADMAALAAVRFTGCGGTLSAVRAAALRSLKDNGFNTALDAGTGTAVTTHGSLSLNTQNIYVFSSISTESDSANAVRVVLTKTIPSSLIMGGLFNNKLSIDATATAKGSPPIATFSMGGSMFTIDNVLTQGFNDLLGGILGNKLQLTPSAYQELAGTSINLKDLMTATGHTTVDELLDSNMTVGDALTAYQNAANLGTITPAASAAMSQLLKVAGTSGLQLQLKDVLKLNTGGDKDALLSVNINLLDLITTSVKVGGKNGVDLDLGVPNLVGLRLEMGSIPQITVGTGGRSNATGDWCTSVKSTQSKISFSLGNGIFSAIKFVINIDLKVSINFGQASAHIEEIQTSPESAKIYMGVQTSPITLTIGNKADTGAGLISILGFFKIEIGQNSANLNVDTPVDIDVKTPIQDSLPIFQAGSSETRGTVAGILASAVPSIKILGINVTAITDPILKIVNTILGTILGNTIDPILRAMGVNIGSADLRIYDVKLVSPQLVQ